MLELKSSINQSPFMLLARHKTTEFVFIATTDCRNINTKIWTLITEIFFFFFLITVIYANHYSVVRKSLPIFVKAWLSLHQSTPQINRFKSESYQPDNSRSAQRQRNSLASSESEWRIRTSACWAAGRLRRKKTNTRSSFVGGINPSFRCIHFCTGPEFKTKFQSSAETLVACACFETRASWEAAMA